MDPFVLMTLGATALGSALSLVLLFIFVGRSNSRAEQLAGLLSVSTESNRVLIAQLDREDFNRDLLSESSGRISDLIGQLNQSATIQELTRAIIDQAAVHKSEGGARAWAAQRARRPEGLATGPADNDDDLEVGLSSDVPKGFPEAHETLTRGAMIDDGEQ